MDGLWRWRHVKVDLKHDSLEKKNLLSFLEHLPIYSEISSRYLGNVIVTHTGIDCNNYVMNADGTINVKSSIKKAFEIIFTVIWLVWTYIKSPRKIKNGLINLLLWDMFLVSD